MKSQSIIIFICITFISFSCGTGQSGNTNEKSNDKKVALDPVKAEVKNINSDQLKELITTASPTLLDVRTPEEWAEGIIAGATKINFHDANFRDEVAKLPKDKEYAVYCAAGGRSASASEMMTEMGFKKVNNLTGGIEEWKSKGDA